MKDGTRTRFPLSKTGGHMARTKEDFNEDGYYDQSFLINKECPECECRLVSHPDHTETCSDPGCDYESRWSDR